jgi:hypothetical protein
MDTAVGLPATILLVPGFSTIAPGAAAAVGRCNSDMAASEPRMNSAIMVDNHIAFLEFDMAVYLKFK